MSMKKLVAFGLVAVMALSLAGCGSSSSSSAPATETETTETSEEETSTVDISEILVELQEKFKQETQTSPYFVIDTGSDEDGQYGELGVYKNEDSFVSGEEDPIEYYYIDAEGNITDSVGNSISLDNFTVRDEVLAALTAGDNFWDVFEEEREYPDADAYILAASGFSEERAWVVISEGGFIHGYLIDTEGNVIYKNDSMDQDGNRTDLEDMTNCTEVVNGVFLMGDTTLIDADGNTVWSVEDDGRSEAEKIFGSGSVTDISLKAEDSWNGYPTVIFSIDTYEYTGTYYGLLNSDGTWIIEPVMGNRVTFEREGRSIYEVNYTVENGQKNEAYFLNVETGEKTQAFGRDKGDTYGQYGYYYYIDSQTGELVKSTSGEYDSGATNQKDSWKLSARFAQHDGLLYDEDVNGFVDASGATVIDLSEYNIENDDDPVFENGYCVLFLRNNGGGHYFTVIDTQGNRLFEPVKKPTIPNMVASFEGTVSDERIWLSDELQYYDLTGQAVGGEYDNLYAYSNGLALVRKSYENTNGNTVTTYLYLDPDGNDVFDVISNVTGQSSSSSSTSSGSSSSDEASEAEEKEYTFISNFTIEGKWKSVGDWGYGQAQPGAIVAFDGKNCNLYSPSDTYAFYADGDHYVLDATGALSGTVTFKVYIIDEDNIDLVVSGGTTELTRVE